MDNNQSQIITEIVPVLTLIKKRKFLGVVILLSFSIIVTSVRVVRSIGSFFFKKILNEVIFIN